MNAPLHTGPISRRGELRSRVASRLGTATSVGTSTEYAEPFSRRSRHPRRTSLPGRFHGTIDRRRDGTRFSMGAKYPKSSPPALNENRGAQLIREAAFAAEVPGERSSLVGPRAFVWSRSNETCHHQGPPEPAKFRLPGEDRTSTAPRGLRCQTKERGSSPPGTMRRAFAALASGGTVGSRWPEGLRRQRSNETRHHPEGAPRIRGEFIFVCRGAL